MRDAYYDERVRTLTTTMNTAVYYDSLSLCHSLSIIYKVINLALFH